MAVVGLGLSRRRSPRAAGRETWAQNQPHSDADAGRLRRQRGRPARKPVVAAPGVPHHTFDIEGPGDPKELIKELEAKGIKVDDLRLHGEGPGYSVYVIDPSGNRLELSKD